MITSIGRLFCSHLRITFSPALGFLEEHSNILFKISPFAICLYCRITWKILIVTKILLDTRFKKVFLASSYHEMFFFLMRFLIFPQRWPVLKTAQLHNFISCFISVLHPLLLNIPHKLKPRTSLQGAAYSIIHAAE